MSKSSLDSIASARAKLEAELRNLEEQEAQLRQEQSSEAFAEVTSLLGQYSEHFSARQKAEISALIGAAPAKAKKSGGPKKEVAQKYWLPHSGDTWSGRGRTPLAFKAWEGSSAYKEWKAKHPDEKFPAFPG